MGKDHTVTRMARIGRQVDRFGAAAHEDSILRFGKAVVEERYQGVRFMLQHVRIVSGNLFHFVPASHQGSSRMAGSAHNTSLATRTSVT